MARHHHSSRVFMIRSFQSGISTPIFLQLLRPQLKCNLKLHHNLFHQKKLFCWAILTKLEHKKNKTPRDQLVSMNLPHGVPVSKLSGVLLGGCTFGRLSFARGMGKLVDITALEDKSCGDEN